VVYSHTKAMICIGHVSLSMQASLASVWVLIGNIDSLIKSFNAAIWVFYGLVFAGLLIMRVTHRHQPRPFKVTILEYRA